MMKCLGRVSAHLSLAMALVVFVIVVLRYVFNLGWVALQELVIYFHAAAFLLAAPFTLQQDGHVRVDVFFQSMKPKTKGFVQLLGLVFLYFPFFLSLLYFCWPYVMDSWTIKESSADPGGLPVLYLLKSLLLFFPITMLLQGVLLGRQWWSQWRES